jgi:hypothetical protein
MDIQLFPAIRLATASAKFAALATALLAFSGCSNILKDRYHHDEASEQVTRVDKHSTFPSVRRIHFEQVNLVELLDPKGEAAEGNYGKAWKKAEDESASKEWSLKYDLALAHFRESKVNEEAKRQHRNSVQDRIMGVATSRCNVFKTYLRRQQADTNFWLGSLTTAAGVLGAIVPAGGRAAGNLAGTAGILSGVNAEFNSEYYSNLAAHVIVQGIEIHQSRMQKELIELRQDKSIAAYSMEAAIKDAIAFDGTCSTVVGLTEAAESIRQSNDPSMATAAKVIAASKAMGAIASASDISALSKSGELVQLLKQTEVKANPLVVSSLKQKNETSLQERLLTAQTFNTRATYMIQQGANHAANQFTAAQSGWGTVTSTVTAKDISTTFAQSLTHAYTSSLQASATACISQIGTVTQNLGSSLFKANVEPLSIDAQKDLGIARAEATASVERVNRYEAELQRVIDATLANWGVKWKEPPRDLTPFKTLAFANERLPKCN